LRQLPELALQARLEFLDVLPRTRALFLGKPLELLGRNHFALFQRSKGKAARQPEQADVQFRRGLLNLAKHPFRPLLELLFDLLHLVSVLRALERRGDGRTQPLH
jgi:hypothetical protein